MKQHGGAVLKPRFAGGLWPAAAACLEELQEGGGVLQQHTGIHAQSCSSNQARLAPGQQVGQQALQRRRQQLGPLRGEALKGWGRGETAASVHARSARQTVHANIISKCRA